MAVRYKPELEATKTPTLIQIAWAAGVYEGEGCCQTTARNRTNMRVTQKDPEILYMLRDWFGGSIVKQGRCMAWLACGDRARLALALFYPLLSSRRKAQIDANGALVFLGGQPSDGMSMEDVAAKLGSRLPFASWSDPLAKEKKKLQKARNYQERRKDPAYVAKCREQSAAGNARLRFEKLAATAPERLN